jgi:ribosomal protein S18 acetylase RimI-like enzyme
MIKKGLYLDKTVNRIMFLCDERGYYQGYGAFNLAGVQEELFIESPIIYDLDYGNELSEIQTRGRTCLEKLGFHDLATSVKMRLSLENFNKNLNNNDSLVSIEHAKMQDLEIINKLWKSSLPSSVYLPINTNELRTFIEKNQVLCAVISGKIVAALQYQIQHGDCSFHHVVVDKNCRGQGLATLLIRTALGFALDAEARNSTVWVLEDNGVALAFYRSIGFREVNKHTKRFLLLRRNI